MPDAELPVVLRAMVIADIPAVLDLQEPGALAALADVFPQHLYPFPRDRIAEDWEREIKASDVVCSVILLKGRLAGFIATRGDELLHFGVAAEHWGSGVARAAHGELLRTMRDAGTTRAWLLVFTGNGRGRRFYEKLGWTAAGGRTRSAFPPYPELLRYERDC